MTTADFEFSVIDSHADWRRWYRSIENKTYIIRHDPDVWHKIGSPNRCILYERINGKISRWGDATKLIRHDSKKQLWATIRLPDHFCIRCGKRLRLKYTECWPCRIRRAKANQPFFDNYLIDDIVLTTQEFEKGYRAFKFLDIRHKLRLTHFNCSTPKRCLHFRWYLYNRKSKLPEFQSKVINDTIQIVKIMP